MAIDLFIIYVLTAALILLPCICYFADDACEILALAVLVLLFGWLILPIVLPVMTIIGFYKLARRIIKNEDTDN